MQTRKTLFPAAWWLLAQGLCLFSLALIACQSEPETEATPDSIAQATDVVETATVAATATLEAEPETPTGAPTLPPPPTTTPLPTSTLVLATATPAATPTEIATVTTTVSPTSPPQPTRPPTTRPPAATQPPAPAGPVDPATLGANVLPNPSFEEGHYDQDGMQMPNGWRIEYDQGNTGFGTQVWDVYIRPEARVLSTAFLPAAEHSIYIFDGSHTVKVFKDGGAISVRLVTDVNLQPGTYVLEVQFFSDLFEAYENDQKIPPGDASAGETRLIAGSSGTNWQGQNYLQKNVVNYTFTLNSAQTIAVGVGLRGRYAIANNGWFLDNFSLRRVQ